MFIFRNKLNFLIVIIFLSSCSSMNVTQEKVNSGGVKTVEATSINNENIRYAEDLDLYIRLRDLSEFFFVNQKLVKITKENHILK